LESFKAQTHANILRIKDLNSRLGGNKTQLRLYDMLPVWRLYIFDDRIFISSYSPDKEGHDTQELEVSSATDLYRAFDREFEYLWETSVTPPELA
jgi:hypothetical protein